MMNIENWTRVVIKRFYSLTEVVMWFGYITVSGVVLIVFIDVCGRYFLNKPLPGAYESLQLAMTILYGVAVMYCTIKRGHVSIDLIINRFSRRTLIIMQGIFSFLAFGTWVMVAYQVYLYALYLLSKSETVGALYISRAPFLLLMAAALFLSSLTSLIQTFHHGVSEETIRKKEDAGNEL